MAKVEKVIDVKLGDLTGHEENPNVMTDAQFNKLVENIQEVGFVEPIQVAQNKDGKYQIIGGHHRVKAAELVGFETLPAVVMSDLNEGSENWQDKRLFHLVRLNIIKGKIDPMKFTAMFDKLSEQYGKEALKESFAFWDERSFLSVYKSVKASLPPELQEKLEEAKKEIKTIEDLSRILNKMFNDYGDSLDKGYMWFSYGGQDHFYVRMEKPLYDTLKKMEKELSDKKQNINDILLPVIVKGYESIDNKAGV